jgi:hypothetical protein
MFGTLSAALDGESQSRRRRTRSTPVVTELEGRALTAYVFTGQILYTTVGTDKVTANNFQPGTHNLYNATYNNIHITNNGLQFGQHGPH